MIDTIAIVGVGLIGGSVGLAARTRKLARRVLGVGRNAEFLDLAVQLGAIDEFQTDPSLAFAESDFILVAAPVDKIATIIFEGSAACRPGTIITDAGSTKAAIAAALAGKLPAQVHYVGSHPLAGSEKSGVQHARADLFDGRTAVVVPGDANATETVETFWRRLGSKTIRMTAEDHDRALAATSHLPHALASALARVLRPEWLPLAASGFRDTTRIAAGDAELWKSIFVSNKNHLATAVLRFRESLAAFEVLLETGDHAGLVRWLDEGKQVRDALGD